ncbi:MAG: bifunctional folylpolyglutamate synthase/dihydrofolate synthase [Anaerorhabdus sp.]
MMKFNNNIEALNWITNRKRVSKGIVSFCEVMKKIGDYQNKIKVIHVAGTNGKGSTVKFIESILMKGKYKVGTFTSPHMTHHFDRISINTKWIGEDDFFRIFYQHLDLILEYELGMFEIDTLIMYQYFYENNVDFAIVEVGIGGRHDSTNCLLTSIISVIVSVGKDHIELLGESISEIAKEKSGIIKDGIDCVVGDVSDEVMDVLLEEAKLKNAKIIKCDELDNNIELKSKALYQRHNAKVAVCVIKKLIQKNLISISEKQIKDGLKECFWLGRYEVVSDKPKVILDGAHNIDGIMALKESLKLERKPLTIIFASLKSKDADNMISELEAISDQLIICEFDYHRARKISDYNKSENILYYKNFQDAYSEALNSVEDGCICICGSLYFISYVKDKLKSR